MEIFGGTGFGQDAEVDGQEVGMDGIDWLGILWFVGREMDEIYGLEMILGLRWISWIVGLQICEECYFDIGGVVDDF